MKLSPSPRHPGQYGFSGCPEAGVVVATDERYSKHASTTERFEKLTLQCFTDEVPASVPS